MSKKLSINNLSVAASLLISFSVAIDLGTWVYSQSESPIFALKLSSAVFSALGYMLAGLVFGHLTTKAYETKGFWLATLPFAGVMAVFYVGFSNVHGIARYIILLEPILYIGSGIATYLYSDAVTVTVEMVQELKARIETLLAERVGLVERIDGLVASGEKLKVINQELEQAKEHVIDKMLAERQTIINEHKKSIASLVTQHQAVTDEHDKAIANVVSHAESDIEALKKQVDDMVSQNAATESEHANVVKRLEAQSNRLRDKLSSSNQDAKMWQAMKEKVSHETFETMLVAIGQQTENQAIEKGLNRRNIANRLRSWSKKSDK